MSLSNRETWGLIHGLLLGSFFLLAFAGGLAELYGLRTRWETAEGITGSVRRLTIGFWTMAVAAWLTVITGTWIVYPWYREKLVAADGSGCEGAQIPIPGKCSPKDFLTSNVSGDTTDWHEFGMEWKEHIAWLAPIFATTAAFIVAYYGLKLAKQGRIRRLTITLFVIAFGTAAVAGILGALITKVAPVK
jgi:hypothetical protein